MRCDISHNLILYYFGRLVKQRVEEEMKMVRERNEITSSYLFINLFY